MSIVGNENESLSLGNFILLLVATVVLFLSACSLLLRFSRRSNHDGSFRVQGAPKNIEKETTDWIFPFQKLSNLPKVEYIRNANDTELSVDILPHEAVYGTMHLSLSSYYSRVYRLKKCSSADIDTLKIAFSRALGMFPILAGRCRQGPNRKISVVFPTECLVSRENSTVSAIGSPGERPDKFKVYGVPFRVYELKGDASYEACPIGKPLTPMDTAKYSVYENPVDVMKGNGAICNVCVYVFPDGSATLSLVVSHAVMDGISIASFEQVWAEESRKLFEMDPPVDPTDPTAWYIHHEPLSNVTPVQRSYIPGPFTDMQDYRDAQKEFFGFIFDDSPSIDGTYWQQFVGWLMIELLLPYLRFFNDVRYLWGMHPDQHRNTISLSKEKITALKQEAAPPEPDWIASQDAVVAVLVKKLVEVRKKQGRYKKKRIRLVLFRDSRPFVGLKPNHAFGLGVLNWPVTIYDPDKLSLSEISVQIRKGLQEMHNDRKGHRFWRMTTTIFEKRRWAFLKLVHKGLYDEGNSDDRLMLNNSIFPLPNFGGEVGEALSLTTQAGPSIMLPEPDGGCRLMIEKELASVLTNDLLRDAFM